MAMPIDQYDIYNSFRSVSLSSVSPTNPYNSDKSVADTIVKMVSLARTSKNSPIVQAAVKDAVRGLPLDSNDESIARAIFWWVKHHVRYIQDETINSVAFGMDDFRANDTELLITPETLLVMPLPMGDCDDFSTLVAAMLCVLDFHCAFVTIAADRSDPEMLSHVYVKVWLSDVNKGMYLDCSHGPYPGWETSYYTRKLEWGIN